MARKVVMAVAPNWTRIPTNISYKYWKLTEQASNPKRKNVNQLNFFLNNNKSIYYLLVLFASNVFKHTVDNEVHYACNQVGCRVIDTLLPLADAATLTRFMIAFGVDLRPLCHDVYASHVLEALVKRTAHISLGRTNDSAEFQAECTQFTVKLSKYLLNNLEDYVWDSYGNYVIRTCLKCLTQLPIVDEDGTTTKKIIQIKEEEIELPDEYVEIVREYGERLISWPQFGELCTVELTSASLQVLLRLR